MRGSTSERSPSTTPRERACRNRQSPPSHIDLSKDLQIDTGLKALGVEQDPSDLAERYGREDQSHTIYRRKYSDPVTTGTSRSMAVFVPKDFVKTYYPTFKVNQADDNFRKGTLFRKR